MGERIQAEMKKLGFDEDALRQDGQYDRTDRSGKKVIVYDLHIDTVGVGDPSEWEWDPFVGKVENGILYARGACDEKAYRRMGRMVWRLRATSVCSMAGHGYYFGNMEGWCDGIAPNTFVEVDPKVKPDFVVIGEPTRMQVYRGHKGRIELKITAHGQSAHAASHYLGDNPCIK